MKQDEDKFIKLISEAISSVVVLAMENMEGRLTLKIEEFRTEAGARFDTLDRKLNAQQDRLDSQGLIPAAEAVFLQPNMPGIDKYISSMVL